MVFEAEEVIDEVSQATETAIEDAIEQEIEIGEHQIGDLDLEIVSTKQQQKNIVDVLFEEPDGSFTVSSKLESNMHRVYSFFSVLRLFLLILI